MPNVNNGIMLQDKARYIDKWKPPNVSCSNFDSVVPNMASTEGELFKHALHKSLQKLNKAEIEIKEKQYQALLSIVKYNKDTICVLPTGYGKSLTYNRK